MRIFTDKTSYKVIAVTIVFALIIVVLLSSCSLSIEKRIKQDKVNEFYSQAINAEVKYGDEPVSGELRPFPASFVLTGKVLWIDIPAFEDLEPLLPADIYEQYSFEKYTWYTTDASEVRYVVLIDIYYSPSDENGLGNSLIFTIVDLSYDEMVYKSFIKGNNTLPYRELAELLEDITL